MRPASRPAWAGSTRRARLPANWPALRAATRDRAGGRCEWSSRVLRELPELARWARQRGMRDLDMPNHDGAQADHIHRGDLHEPANLAWLCADHHQVKSSWEGGTAGERQTRPREKHPGLL